MSTRGWVSKTRRATQASSIQITQDTSRGVKWKIGVMYNNKSRTQTWEA